MTDHENHRPRFPLNRRARFAAIGAGLLALGGTAGAIVMAETRPSVSMAPAVPVAIRTLSSTGIVTIRGRVAEVYGNKFVLQDGTGRALIDTGREGDRGQLVAIGQPVTVQGRFDHGFVHAAFLIGPDKKVQALGPLAGPPHRPHDGPDGGPDHGPDRGPNAPPPPRPDATSNAPPPPPSASVAAPAAATPGSASALDRKDQ